MFNHGRHVIHISLFCKTDII